MKIMGLPIARRKMMANSLVAIQFGMLLALAILAINSIKNSNHPYLPFEIVLIASGGIVILSAAKTLNLSLRISPIPRPNSAFVISGIYRRVRHPMYLGVILIGFGLAGFSDSLFAWILELILVVNLNIKANFEDALLDELHPQSWHYREHTSKIIPCLSRSCRTDCRLPN